jgi:hypothetical protein
VTLEFYEATLFHRMRCMQRTMRSGRDKNSTWYRVPLNSAGNVHRVAENLVVEPAFAHDPAVDRARVQADPQLNAFCIRLGAFRSGVSIFG